MTLVSRMTAEDRRTGRREEPGTMMATAASSWFWIWPTLVVLGSALLGYLGYRMIGSRPENRDTAGTARRILDERFARGEIDEGDYRRRRADLL